MAYQVVKTVNGRGYRYEVRSERDPATGKARNRWTYLGRVEAGTRPATPARRRGDARSRLLDALERLLERSDLERVTADAISVEARVAHGTFYRYFPNKTAAVRASVERLRDTRGAARLALEPDATLAAARSVLRGWAHHVLAAPGEHRGILRAWSQLAERDADVAAARRSKRGEVSAGVAAFLAACAARGFAPIADADGTAAALIAMVEGFYREALAAAEPVADGRVAAAVDLIERGVFGRTGGDAA